MHNQIPPDALLGNRLFNVTLDVEDFRLMQTALTTAWQEAKPHLIVGQNCLGPDESIDPVEASGLYQLLYQTVEEDVLNFAERHSPAAWLWYLRRLPLFFFAFDQSHASAYRTSDLAEIVTGLHRAHAATAPESLEPLRYGLDQAALVDLLRFCGKVQLLRKIQQRIRTAGKGVYFKYIPDDLPIPTPTASQREAMASYDQRVTYPFLSRTGTLLGELDRGTDTIVIALKDFSSSLQVPSEAVDAYAEHIPSAVPMVRIGRSVKVPTKFRLLEVSLPDLQLFSIEHLDVRARMEVAHLVMLLRIAREMVIERRPAYGIFQVGQIGYIIEDAVAFAGRLTSSFEELYKFANRLLPEESLPATVQDLLFGLEAMQGSAWPLVPGPVIRHVGDSLMIDIYLAAMRLEAALAFKILDGAPVNRRAKHFEDQVQRLIDESSWGTVPEELRALRQRKCIRRADGTPLTDVDAIGTQGNTVLIIDCKSRIDTDAVFLGDYLFARKRAKQLEIEVRKCRELEEYLRNHPSLPQSYDFSGFSQLVIVICTPASVYMELGMVQDAGLRVDELLSTQEVLPGLLGAVSLVELVEWLHSPFPPTGKE